ncbi:MAG: nucleotidyltransferase family protein, partial [Bacteroidales bacterium]|nr:nucleotidyltransferase family protein [Bacteroidales bacterium]
DKDYSFSYFCLKMKTKDNILQVLKSSKPEFHQLGIRELGLFGSYVKGNESTDSDIDILIDFDPKKENFDNFMAAYDLFEELFKDEKIEVVTKKGLSPYIGPAILKEVIYV